MVRSVSLVIIISNVLMVRGFPNAEPKVSVSHEDEDSGSPLFLTPYIESGNIDEARNLSRVDFPGFPNIASYAGFFTVDKNYNSNLFLWYFPAKSYLQEQIVILWLQGGPGISSLVGLFEENGPLEVKNDTFHERKTHWAQHHHMIYIDSPVGTGFSFTNNSRGYCTNQTQVGEHLYATLIQFFQMFPELQKYKFFISGESYAGKYIPALGYTIHKKNPTAKTQINLKGLIIGNGFCDPINQLDYGNYLYQIGLIDWNQKDKTDEFQNQIIDLIKKEAWYNATHAFLNLYGYITESTGNISMYNYLPSVTAFNLNVLSNVIQRVPIRRAIHVGNLTFNDENLVQNALIEDFMKSVAPWISELLEHYHMLFYNGQVDIIVAYPLTVNFLRRLNFSGSAEYSETNRIIMYDFVHEELEGVGFAKSAGKLTEALIRGAGHMVPLDKPGWIYNLLIWWRQNIVNESLD